MPAVVPILAKVPPVLAKVAWVKLIEKLPKILMAAADLEKARAGSAGRGIFQGPVAKVRGQVESLEARVDSLEASSATQAQSIAEIRQYEEDLRCWMVSFLGEMRQHEEDLQRWMTSSLEEARQREVALQRRVFGMSVSLGVTAAIAVVALVLVVVG